MKAHSLIMVFFPLVFLWNQNVFAQAFRDVSKNHTAHEAITDLAERGIFRGYSDGTFRMERPVSRAEIAAILVRSSVDEQAYKGIKRSTYKDISSGAWYHPHVEVLHARNVIDGPPETQKFYGERAVTLVEFLKMLFLNDYQDIDQYRSLEIPIAEDVDDPYTWFYPYIAHGVAATMITPYLDASLHPGKQLTRADVALYLHRYLLYKEGGHVRRAKLLIGENITDFYHQQSIEEESDVAEQLYFRALLIANGLHASDPSSREFLALKRIAESAMHTFMGEQEEAQQLLQDAKRYSPVTYRKYFKR